MPASLTPSLDAFAEAKLAGLNAAGLRRRLVPTARTGGARAERGGRPVVSFSCNDYLGLATHPAVVAAARAALERYGAGSGGSRLVTGDHPVFAELEAELARRKGHEAALVFGSGYLANLGITPALAGAGDLILIDELGHSCMWAGTRLSGARTLPFRHNDLKHLEALLARERGEARHALILTERVFSMDGDRAPVADILDLARSFDAWTLVDDAHGLGVVGPDATAPLEMGTLSKALGSYGGYLCASRAVIDLLTSRARSFVYTTGLPPASAAAALAALRLIEAEPERAARPLALARRFTARLGLPEAQSAVVPVLVGEAEAALALSRALEARGFLVVAIRPPTVPAGTARLRIAFSAAHAEAEVDALAQALSELGAAG
ncbi:aminotransferase class I/II-fold pyridoxal phosphate-dependent enzyme [Methylobacterium nodulans]|uniref:8-amino-7-oxononanoate synthase n=1 Tax=Methylobacterium nodulans (strain LMG 21967 / CNCM I-2342 / ORS 2060) TaxID=460265 RepID=BIOF_METNO|nr:aminotransferase class I/II-fold pyridoxal phosphate-dependent enzyme [Methylobacterium nodulans]B8IBW2.1 RecName: Full=8-amino-7-oxononanoate synthase; Short=AONS; AltName: Full=7-keto-8-amino-pelargonic acid synthase; Short=7-KAP synthase; Short=KAPA synthase; AltName: Full=8-amino-7-ketopelargonate synthase; AltName: Full=Alpha-oxoamine synthase [Methylobacterium nodulans ORS 2060]ACL61144.1 8-amino-7-oxononanoate synthase [Methylobacterium nodulans ORS 2060]